MAGCVGDGVTDDSANAQAAIDAAVSGTGILGIDAGTFYVPAGLVIPAPLNLIGANRARSILKAGPADVLNVTTAEAVEFSNFSIAGEPGGSNKLINITPSGQHNGFSTLRDLGLTGGRIAAYMGNAAWWTIDRCYIYKPMNHGVYVESVSEPDAGDSSIANCIISYPGSAGIWQASSGGLRIENSKLIGGVHGYLLKLTPGIITSDLIAVGNSIENMTNGFVGVWDDVHSFSNVIILGNQFSNVRYPTNLPAYGKMVIGPNVIQ